MLILRPWESFADGVIWVRRTLEGEIAMCVFREWGRNGHCFNSSTPHDWEPHDSLGDAIEWCESHFGSVEWREAMPEELGESVDLISKVRGLHPEPINPVKRYPEKRIIDANDKAQNQLAADAIVEALSPEALWRLGERLRKVAGPWEHTKDRSIWWRRLPDGITEKVYHPTGSPWLYEGELFGHEFYHDDEHVVRAAVDEALIKAGYELVNEEE